MKECQIHIQMYVYGMSIGKVWLDYQTYVYMIFVLPFPVSPLVFTMNINGPLPDNPQISCCVFSPKHRQKYNHLAREWPLRSLIFGRYYNSTQYIAIFIDWNHGYESLLLSMAVPLKCPLCVLASTDNQAATGADQGPLPGLSQRGHSDCGWWGFHQCCSELLRGNLPLLMSLFHYDSAQQNDMQ